MRSDPFIRQNYMKPPSLDKDIWEEWLLSALERNIYMENELHYDQIFNKEVLEYFKENVDYAKAELKKLDELYDLHYLDYNKQEINYIAPLIITILKYSKADKVIVDLIKATSYYAKLQNKLIEDSSKPVLSCTISSTKPIVNKQSKFFYSPSNKTRVVDSINNSIKFYKVN